MKYQSLIEVLDKVYDKEEYGVDILYHLNKAFCLALKAHFKELDILIMKLNKNVSTRTVLFFI